MGRDGGFQQQHPVPGQPPALWQPTLVTSPREPPNGGERENCPVREERGRQESLARKRTLPKQSA